MNEQTTQSMWRNRVAAAAAAEGAAAFSFLSLCCHLLEYQTRFSPCINVDGPRSMLVFREPKIVGNF
jgi:hypothetical protein